MKTKLKTSLASAFGPYRMYLYGPKYTFTHQKSNMALGPNASELKNVILLVSQKYSKNEQFYSKMTFLSELVFGPNTMLGL